MASAFTATSDDVNGAITAVYGAISGALSNYGMRTMNVSIGALGVTESVEVVQAIQSGDSGEVVVQSAGWIGGVSGAAYGAAEGAWAGRAFGKFGAIIGGSVGAYYGGKYGEEAAEAAVQGILGVGEYLQEQQRLRNEHYENWSNDPYKNKEFSSLTWSQIIHGIELGIVDFGTRCFPGRVEIRTADARIKTISRVRPDDTVLSFDPSADNGRGDLVPKRVTCTFTNITEEWLRLRWVENGEEKELVTTPGHHFLDRFGNFPQIERMIADGVGTVILADGSEATVTAARIVYCAETADMFEQAEGWVTPEVGLAFVAPDIVKMIVQGDQPVGLTAK